MPGDQAAGRVRDAKVHTERLFQQAQDAKRRAAEALSRGDAGGALAAYAAGRARWWPRPAAASPELREEAAILAELAARTAAGDGAWAAKRSRAEHALKARKRGSARAGAPACHATVWTIGYERLLPPELVAELRGGGRRSA